MLLFLIVEICAVSRETQCKERKMCCDFCTYPPLFSLFRMWETYFTNHSWMAVS